MELYEQNENYTLYQGSMLDMEENIKENSIDSIVTDPPYELNFMDKGWDNSGISFQKETWEKCFKVLKPGGHMLVFGGTRTFHRIACAIEDAGFEIRDTIAWIYGSGMTKGMNIGLALDKRHNVESDIIGTKGDMPDFQQAGKQNSVGKIGFNDGGTVDRKENYVYKAQNEWDGWNTQLKPAYEPIIVVRKPCENSILDNIEKYGVGGINVDECRIPHNEPTKYTNRQQKNGDVFNTETCGFDNTNNHLASADTRGRFPSNIILTYDETDKEEVCGGMPNRDQPNGSITKSIYKNGLGSNGIYNYYSDTALEFNSYGDSGCASRYYYCAKASTKDREEGLTDFEAITDGAKGDGIDQICEFCGASILKPELCKCKVKSWITPPRKNVHPTVKPCDLMQYLVRLVTPKGGTILDCFNGSGSTGKAVMWENKERDADYKYIGIELSGDYLRISKARIDYVRNLKVKTKEEAEQLEKELKEQSKYKVTEYKLF